jgi:hypothetical protein
LDGRLQEVKCSRPILAKRRRLHAAADDDKGHPLRHRVGIGLGLRRLERHQPRRPIDGHDVALLAQDAANRACAIIGAERLHASAGAAPDPKLRYPILERMTALSGEHRLTPLNPLRSLSAKRACAARFNVNATFPQKFTLLP